MSPGSFTSVSVRHFRSFVNRFSKFRIWLNRIVGIAMILLVIGLSIFYVWLNSSPGLDWVCRSLASATGGIVELSGLTGRLPFHLTARQLILRDSDHVEWLVARDISARTQLRAIIRRELAISRITVGFVEWRLFPHFHSSADAGGITNRPVARILPEPLNALRLDDAFISGFMITTNIIHHAFSGSLKGNARWYGHDHVYAEATGPVLAGGVVSNVLDVIFKFEHGQLIFPRLNIGSRSDSDWFEGAASYTIRNRALASTGECSVADTALYVPFHGLPIRGPAQARLAANHEQKGKPWEFVVRTASEAFSFRDYTNRNMKLDGSILVSRDATEYELDYQADTASVADWNFQQIGIQANGTNTSVAFSLETAGQFKTNSSFSITSHHQIFRDPSSGAWNMLATQLNGAWNNRPVSVKEPAAIEINKESIEVKVPSVHLADGTGSARLRFDENKLADATIE